MCAQRIILHYFLHVTYFFQHICIFSIIRVPFHFFFFCGTNIPIKTSFHYYYSRHQSSRAYLCTRSFTFRDLHTVNETRLLFSLIKAVYNNRTGSQSHLGQGSSVSLLRKRGQLRLEDRISEIHPRTRTCFVFRRGPRLTNARTHIYAHVDI